jgi:O-antigen ligase
LVRWKWPALPALALLVGGLAALLTSRPLHLAVAAAALLFVGFAVRSLRHPLFFVLTFVVVLIVLPPFFSSRTGEAPIYISIFLLPVGFATLVARLPDFQSRLDPLAKGLTLFLFGTGLSLPFAFWFSGAEIGAASLLRWLLLAQTAIIYVLVRGGAPTEEGRAERWLVPVLAVAALVSAAYGVADFLWPVPLPHTAADQYIWLGSGVLRRAQGVFYEAANFANLCAFFLVLASAALLVREERALRLSRTWMWLMIPILSLGLFLSFTRSAWANVVVSIVIFAAVSRGARLSRGLVFLFVLAIPAAMLWYYAPEVWGYLLDRRLGYLAQIFADPDQVSSGRFETWRRVLSIFADHPHYLLFGVGYKTLPYTRLFHGEIIMDNGYMNLLLETGVVGLASFVTFSALLMRTFLRLARRGSAVVAFWGAVFFAFWCGELVQMVAVDAYTFWRNMTVFIALMGFALNRAEREGLCKSVASPPAVFAAVGDMPCQRTGGRGD